MSSNLENIKIKHQSLSSDEHTDRFTFPPPLIILPPPGFVSACHFGASQNSIFWKYKKQTFSGISFLEAFSLAERYSIKNLQCCEFYELLPTVYHGYIFFFFLLCSIYMFILRVGPTRYVKTCSVQLLGVGLWR